jgi:hypothetical protein
LVVVLFAAAVLIFVVQNFTMVTMSFLGFSARAPVALLVAWFTFWAWQQVAASGRCCGDRFKGQSSRTGGSNWCYEKFLSWCLAHERRRATRRQG